MKASNATIKAGIKKYFQSKAIDILQRLYAAKITSLRISRKR
jgi:hypothetical protein